MDSFITPPGWKNGPLSPTDKELQWLFAWLRAHYPTINGRFRDGVSALEFGAGATSLCIQQAMHPGLHVMIESYGPATNAIRGYIPPPPFAVVWADIRHVSEAKWDLALVDSSAGVTPSGAAGYHRDEAVRAALPHMAPGAHFILHDWHAAGGRKPRKLLESLGWDLVDACYDRTGWGVYRHV